MGSRTSTSPQRLSRDVLIDACIRIADSEGPEAVTLRRLGAELRVDPTAAYRHFRDKDELLSAMADRLLTEAFAAVELTGDWRQDMRALALRMRAAYLTHPRVALLVFTATAPLPTEARLSETGLAIIRGAGFAHPEATTIFEVLESYTLAVSCMDGMGSATPPERWRRSFAALPPESFPNLAASASHLYGDADARFEFGLDLILDAIEARGARSGATRETRGARSGATREGNAD